MPKKLIMNEALMANPRKIMWWRVLTSQ